MSYLEKLIILKVGLYHNVNLNIFLKIQELYLILKDRNNYKQLQIIQRLNLKKKLIQQIYKIAMYNKKNIIFKIYFKKLCRKLIKQILYKLQVIKQLIFQILKLIKRMIILKFCQKNPKVIIKLKKIKYNKNYKVCQKKIAKVLKIFKLIFKKNLN